MLTSRQQKFVKDWEKKRGNKSRYYWTHSLLLAFIYTILAGIWFLYKDNKIINQEFLIDSLRRFIVFAFIGYFMLGKLNYKAMEKKYQILLDMEKEDETEDPLIGNEWKTDDNK